MLTLHKVAVQLYSEVSWDYIFSSVIAPQCCLVAFLLLSVYIHLRKLRACEASIIEPDMELMV